MEGEGKKEEDDKREGEKRVDEDGIWKREVIGVRMKGEDVRGEGKEDF